ncbi:MAG TPA: trypsin-like peptidase domain-containing protein [Gemmataceae bacterium]|nr:trypsin-like peptidase domain-containing protein [Gemmataceae bacterium]
MSIQMACPGCGASYTLSDELRGKKVRCKKCEEIFAVNGAAKGDVKEPIEPAEKVRPGARATAAPGRRRGEDGNGPTRIATRTAAKPVRRRGEDPEDEAHEPSQRSAAAKPGGSRTPFIIGGAVLGVLLLLGVVVAIVLSKGGEPAKQTSNRGTQSVTQPDSLPKTDGANLGQGNPSSQGTEPEDGKSNDRAGKPGSDAKLGVADILERVKKSTVYIFVVSGGLTQAAAGSGWFGVEPGIIITNAHVVSMMGRGSQPPDLIKVVLNSGEEDEWATPGTLIGVDSGSDLAILRIKGPPDKIPPPLKVVPTSTVSIGQKLYVVGFPLGLKVNKKASIRQTSVAGFVRDRGRIQLEGGADHGNSGGPVVNTNGDVVGVLVEGEVEPDNPIRYAIRGDHVHNVLNGRVTTVMFHEPYRVEPGKIKVPVTVEVVDPLGRLQEVGIDCWKGAPGASRPAATSQPEKAADDSEHQLTTLTLDRKKNEAVGELTLPEKGDGEAYWYQPFVTSAKGTKQWSAANVCSLYLPAAERRPANLVFSPSTFSQPVELNSKSTYRLDTGGEMLEVTTQIKTKLTESTRPSNNQGVSEVALEYNKLEMKRWIYTFPDPDFKKPQRAMQDIKYMRAFLQVDRSGGVVGHRIDLSNVPVASRNFLEDIGDEVQFAMANLAVPLPNQQVQPGGEWPGAASLLMGTAGQLEAVVFEMKYKYVGSRRRAGREEAVIAVEGKVAPPRQNQGMQGMQGMMGGMTGGGRQLKVATKATGFARGTATVDVATGRATFAQTVVDLDGETTISVGDGLSATRRFGGRLELSLRRGR